MWGCVCVCPHTQSSLTSLPDALLPDSVLGCITEDEPFFNCWMHTLEHQALKQFNTAADTDHAWQVRTTVGLLTALNV